MKTIEKDIEFARGDTFPFTLTFEGLGQDLSTCYLTCRVEKDRESEMLFQKSLDNGISKVTDIPELEDTYRVRIAPEDTNDLDLGQYYYDVEIGVNHDIYTVLRGKLKLTWEVTDRSE